MLFLCNEEYVFLIKRSENMPTHGGQIAFVGGHKKSGESHPSEVAFREFEEETQLSRNVIQYLGHLPVVMTARMQPIIPVMARLTVSPMHFLQEVKSNGEWDEVMAYPWKELLIEDQWEFAWRHGYGKSPVMFHPIRPGSYLSKDENGKSHILWGATAQMIWMFLRKYFAEDII